MMLSNLKYHITISNICKTMRQYQKINDIKSQCMTNTQTLYDIIKASFPSVDVKVKAVVCCARVGDNTIKHIIHLIIIADGEYYDPSYETCEIDNRQYFSSIQNLLEGFIPNTIIKDNLKEIINPFMKFIDIEKRINSGEFLICDRDFYDKQLDCIIRVNN